MSQRRPIFTTNVISNLNYRYGLVNIIEASQIPRGAASSEKNWLSFADRIELRRATEYLGSTTLNDGNGKTSGLKTVIKSDGTEILFGTYGQKCKYFDEVTGEWIEVGSNLLGSAVVDSAGISSEPISLSEYNSPLAGNQLFINSPNCAGFFKILLANPGSAVDQYDASKNFKGHIKIDTSRTLLWQRIKDRTSVYGSYIDAQNNSTVTAESIGSGDGTTKVFTGTLVARTGKRTLFAIAVTGGSVVFSDDYNGNLTATDGSTGTINYATGAISVTFISAPGAGVPVTVTYQWEDSTSNGVADFTYSGTRVASQGFLFPQAAGGGSLENIESYNGSYYCLHLKKTWILTIGVDDTAATNLIYRERVGIPNRRASVATGGGIYYIDDQNPADVRVRLLTLGSSGLNVIPVPVTKNLDLRDYVFDESAAIEWGRYILFACKQSGSDSNDRVLILNKDIGAWDVLDYTVSCFEIYNGTLVAGDSLSNNFFTLFSGYDDLGAEIDNFRIGNADALNYDGLKKEKKFYIKGLIMPDQKLAIYAQLDNGQFVEIDSSDESVAETYVENLSDSFSESNQNQDATLIQSSNFTQVGQTFTASVVGNISRALFYLKKGSGTPTGTMTAKLYAMTGTYGSTGVPTGAALATSDAVNVSTLTSSYSLITFTFSTSYSMAASTNYCIVLDATAVSGDGSNYVSMGMKSSGGHSGNRFTQSSGNYTADAVRDFCFYVYENVIDQPATIVHHPAIEGDGSYVDRGSPVTIGSRTLGTKVIGGGSAGDVAYPYEKLIKLSFDKFERITIKFQALSIGYVSVMNQKYWDVRYSQKKVPLQYRGN